MEYPMSLNPASVSVKKEKEFIKITRWEISNKEAIRQVEVMLTQDTFANPHTYRVNESQGKRH